MSRKRMADKTTLLFSTVSVFFFPQPIIGPSQTGAQTDLLGAGGGQLHHADRVVGPPALLVELDVTGQAVDAYLRKRERRRKTSDGERGYRKMRQ